MTASKGPSLGPTAADGSTWPAGLGKDELVERLR